MTEILHQTKHLQRQHTGPCTSQVIFLLAATACSFHLLPLSTCMPSCGSQVGVLWLCCTRSDWGLAAVTPTKKTKNSQLLRQPSRLEEQVFPANTLEAGKCHPRNFTSDSFSLWLFSCFRHLLENPNKAVRFPDVSVFKKKNLKFSQPYSN